MRVVFDTNTVISALLFRQGRLRWMRRVWRDPGVTPLGSRDTVNELIRVITYPKFGVSQEQVSALLSMYTPCLDVVEVESGVRGPLCADPKDQMFVELALAGNADVIVSGDKALLEMEMRVPVETPAEFRKRVSK